MQTSKRTSKAILLLMCLAGCGAWRAASAAENGGLEAALRATLSRHPAISGKRAEVSAKVYTSDSVRAQRLPSFSAQLASQDQNTSTPLATLRARQPLWAFGRIDSGIAYADADVLAEQADMVRLRRQLIDQTVVAYAHVQGALQRLHVAGANVAGMDQLYQQIQRREHGQLASVADVRLALSRLLQARAQRDRIEGERVVAASELLALTQIPVPVEPELPAALTALPGAAAVETQAQNASADVQLRIQQLALAKADVGREETSSRPTVALQVDRYMNQSAYGNGPRVSLVLDANLDGLGFVAAGRNKASGARLQAAGDNLDATRNEVRRVVQNLYYNRSAQQDQITAQRDSVTELTAILASYQRQYQAGQKAWLDVLNMQREMSDQMIQQAQAENDWLVYTLKLQALTGGLDALVGEKKD